MDGICFPARADARHNLALFAITSPSCARSEFRIFLACRPRRLPTRKRPPSVRFLRLNPGGKGVQQFDHNLRIGPPASPRHVKGMIRVRKFLQTRPVAERLAEGLELPHICERIPSPLQKKHGNMNLEKMLAAALGWASGRMQRKSKKRQAPNTLQGRRRLSLRRHAAPEGLPSGDEEGIRQKAQRLARRSANGGLGKFWRIGPLAAPLHIGELIAQRGDAALGKTRRNRRHEGMRHASACAMRQHETGAGFRRRLQKPRNPQGLIDRCPDRLCLKTRHARAPYQGRSAYRVSTHQKQKSERGHYRRYEYGGVVAVQSRECCPQRKWPSVGLSSSGREKLRRPFLRGLTSCKSRHG